MKQTMRQVKMAGSIKTTFGAVAMAAATVFAMGSTASPAAAADTTTVSASAGACTAGGECTVTVRVTAGEGLHVNTEYNHKVTASGDGVAFLGKSDPKSLFSRDNGDFQAQGDKVGVITVKFKPAAKGKVKIGGTYKYATCSEGKGGGCTPGSGAFGVEVTVK